MLKYHIAPVIPKAFESEFPELPPLVLQLLYNRNIRSQEDIEAFLTPEYHHINDPFLFRDMSKACDRIYASITADELVAIHGDYDADGVSGSVILQKVLRSLGARTIIYIPHREKEGYGLNKDTVSYLHSKKVQLLITCDCGIGNSAEIEYAAKLGIDTIITDHHQIPDELPKAFAIVHPKLDTETYPFREFAGGGVAFKLVQGLLRSPQSTLSKQDSEIAEKWLLDLVAISTVADMVPLIGENRALTKFGLIVLSKTRRVGLKKMYEIGGIDPKTISTETISFQIAPRINAAGRMDHANIAFALLSTDISEEASRLAAQLEEQNKVRQKITETVFQLAAAELANQEGKVLFFVSSECPAGLTGLVAGKLVKKFNRPVFVINTDGERAMGSGRSIGSVNLMGGIHAAKDLLTSYGGHPQACGFRFPLIRSDDVLLKVRSYFESTIQQEDLLPRISVDKEIDFQDIDWTTADYIERCEPFGQGNDEPLFFTSHVRVISSRRVGQTQKHLKLMLLQTDKKFPAIAFGEARDFRAQSLVSITFNIRRNRWNGTQELQLNIHTLDEES